jgi:two-component system, NarL family, response regulator YdfI
VCCGSRARSTSCAAACASRSRFRRTRSAPALPDRAHVAIEGGEEARDRLARTLAPHANIVALDAADVVVRDTAGARDALEAIAAGFTMPTILLVDDPHADVALAALRAGAAAVLARQSDARELLAALDAVSAGLVVLDASVRDALAPAVTASRTGALAEPLTERERQVLAMLAGGLSNRRIAERLAISDNTVKAHVAAILAKLGATTRTEAVTAGIRLGLVVL